MNDLARTRTRTRANKDGVGGMNTQISYPSISCSCLQCTRKSRCCSQQRSASQTESWRRAKTGSGSHQGNRHSVHRQLRLSIQSRFSSYQRLSLIYNTHKPHFSFILNTTRQPHSIFHHYTFWPPPTLPTSPLLTVLNISL